MVKKPEQQGPSTESNSAALVLAIFQKLSPEKFDALSEQIETAAELTEYVGDRIGDKNLLIRQKDGVIYGLQLSQNLLPREPGQDTEAD